MTALGVDYLQFWNTNTIKVEGNFYFHFNVLNATFYVPCTVGQCGKTIITLLSFHNLDLQCSHFKTTMIHNSEVVMCDFESNLNLLTQLWHKVTTSPTLNHKLSKYMKFAKIVVIQVFISIENEHTFNTFNFMKNQL